MASSAPSAVATPLSGATYTIQNFATKHWLDNSFSDTSDGNPILTWVQNTPETNNQIWTYLTYPSDSLGNLTAFTLQSVSTVQSVPDFDGRGGYVRVDTQNGNQIVQGGGPMAWKLLNFRPDLHPGTFKFIPYDFAISNPTNPQLVVTDINPNVTSPAENQAQLTHDGNLDTQLWQFFQTTPN